MFDDRLLLGLKGTMAEAELQVLRARMLGGLRNKAARGELRVPLPAGLVWGEALGQILLHPDEAVRGAIGAVFDRFAVSGSARQVWLWLRENGLKLPSLRDGQLAWVTAAYPAVHKILTHPAYWVRDVTYQEDKSLVRTGNAPRVMASLRVAWPSASCAWTATPTSPPPTITTPGTRSGPSSYFCRAPCPAGKFSACWRH
jgi:hypothetical protein